ncbi:uncharacterized protein LOC125646149 [Ostrea edulis]|uniref:uncharacterized protein LOC125646149 n=1 Tax=Ostrea edulis TaxID=37623 RepID=UPI0024AF693B|nr:uncharacterized protein LOC125646149 [Ostrea edulis]
MSNFTCLCLNVKIACKAKPSFQQSPDLWKTKYEFFSQSLAQATDAEVKKEHPYLVHKHAVGEWIVNRCLNCGVETHATSQGSSIMLLSPQLQSDPVIAERLTQSSDFSKIFNIVLHGQKTTISSHDMPDPSSKNYESLQQELTHVQSQINSYLLEEEGSMEKKIREFEEEQRGIFQTLQSSVQTEKKKMINLILQAERELKSSVQEKNELPNTSTVKEQSSKKTPLTRAKSSPNKRLHSVDEYEQTPDTEEMFLLEDENPGPDEPFYTSDEEDDSERSSCTPAAKTVPFQKRSLQYSSSVPIQVPRWGAMFNKDSEEDTDEDPAPSDPDEMAASMQAMARSITNDERMIFGDRPRPRLNTGDFHH